MEKNKCAIHEVGAMLPEMAALFFDDLTSNPSDTYSSELFKPGLGSDLNNRIQFLRLPTDKIHGPHQSHTRSVGMTFRDSALTAHRQKNQYTSLRSLVLNLSHAYNNILMGILGHVTLIKLDLKGQPETQQPLQQMEHLIQTGANLINMVFGYLIERRLPAKKLQLIQLFGEFELCGQAQGNTIDVDGFKENMKRLSAMGNQTKIIAALARVMAQLLSWLAAESASLKASIPQPSRNQSHLSIVEALLDRGYRIVQDLKLYAGEIKPKIRRTSLRILIRQQIQRLRCDYPAIDVWEDLPKRWPWVFVDPQQIEYAIQSVLDNAVQSMPRTGSLTIRVRTLTQEPPSERCVVHSRGDYVVVSVSDSGPGMDMHTQSRMFQPFFKNKTGPVYHPGLGLSAASGILKSHGGYIQVQSAPGSGTRVKIYLPANRPA